MRMNDVPKWVTDITLAQHLDGWIALSGQQPGIVSRHHSTPAAALAEFIKAEREFFETQAWQRKIRRLQH